MLKIQDLIYSLPKEGIIALENKRDKKVHIIFSIDTLKAILKLSLELRDSGSEEHKAFRADLPNVEFVTLETGTPEIGLRASYNLWEDKYRNAGYSFYLPRGNKAITYRPEFKVESHKGELWRVLVYLKNYSGSEKILCGVFKTMLEAHEWVNTVFPVIPAPAPVICGNELTKRFKAGLDQKAEDWENNMVIIKPEEMDVKSASERSEETTLKG